MGWPKRTAIPPNTHLLPSITVEQRNSGSSSQVGAATVRHGLHQALATRITCRQTNRPDGEQLGWLMTKRRFRVAVGIGFLDFDKGQGQDEGQGQGQD